MCVTFPCLSVLKSLPPGRWSRRPPAPWGSPRSGCCRHPRWKSRRGTLAPRYLQCPQCLSPSRHPARQVPANIVNLDLSKYGSPRPDCHTAVRSGLPNCPFPHTPLERKYRKQLSWGIKVFDDLNIGHTSLELLCPKISPRGVELAKHQPFIKLFHMSVINNNINKSQQHISQNITCFPIPQVSCSSTV